MPEKLVLWMWILIFFFPERKPFPSRGPVWGASPFPFRIIQITSRSIISLASPLRCGNYKKEKENDVRQSELPSLL